MSEIVGDIFDTEEIVMPVDVVSPTKKPIVKSPESVSQSKTVPDPAFQVLKRNSLTETEHTIYNIALEGIDAISDTFGNMDERLSRDCAKIKLELLDILARKFGYRSATEAREHGLSFKLKGNYEIELLKAGK